MRTIVSLIVVLAALAAPRTASAIPCAFYNPANGNIRMVNDTRATLFAFYLKSASFNGFVNNGNAFATIPGTTFDSGDLPWAFTYLNFPAGTYNIGNVAKPNLPITEYTLGYYVTFSPLVFGGEYSLATWIPEPASALLASLGLFGFAAVRRRPAGR